MCCHVPEGQTDRAVLFLELQWQKKQVLRCRNVLSAIVQVSRLHILRINAVKKTQAASIVNGNDEKKSGIDS